MGRNPPVFFSLSAKVYAKHLDMETALICSWEMLVMGNHGKLLKWEKSVIILVREIRRSDLSVMGNAYVM